MKKIFLLVVLVSLLGVLMVGCGETYDIQNDTEFHGATDKAIEEAFRGGDVDAIFDGLYEEFSDRYSEEEMDEFAAVRMDKIQEAQEAKITELEQNITETAAKTTKYLEEASDKADYKTMLKKIEKKEQELEKLEAEYQGTTDLYRMVELLEELVVIHEDIMGIVEEAVK